MQRGVEAKLGQEQKWICIEMWRFAEEQRCKDMYWNGKDRKEMERQG